MGVETKGFLELTDEIAKMADLYVDEGGEKLPNIVRKGAKPILDQAKMNVHSVSGELRDSLKIVVKSKGGRTKARIGAQKGGKGHYATFVEYGHGGPHPAGPHPFLAPAFDAKQEEALDVIKGGIQSELRQMW